MNKLNLFISIDSLNFLGFLYFSSLIFFLVCTRWFMTFAIIDPLLFFNFKRPDITRMNLYATIKINANWILNQYKNSNGIIEIILRFNQIIGGNQMTNLGLEIVFWLILLTYLGARLTQTKKGYKQQY